MTNQYQEDVVHTPNRLPSWIIWLIILLALLLVCFTCWQTQLLAEKLASNGWLIQSPVVMAPQANPTAVSNLAPVQGDCVPQRMQPGQWSEYFTTTWDSETRVWVIIGGAYAQGPYSYDYGHCADPDAAIKRQPFSTGNELSPVNGKPFVVCYDFLGNCSR